jgi:hypothetical protein
MVEVKGDQFDQNNKEQGVIDGLQRIRTVLNPHIFVDVGIQ